MLQIEFKTDGRIGIFAMQDGTVLNVTTDINRLQAMVPAPTFAELRERMQAFLDATAPAPRIQAVR